jgi:hypothetical protein
MDLDEDATQAAVEVLAASVLVIKASTVCAWCKSVVQTLRMPSGH